MSQYQKVLEPAVLTVNSYFKQFAPTGILLPDTSPRDGIFDSAKDPLIHQGIGGAPQEVTHELLDAAHATPEYRKFLKHPNLRSFIREFMGWEKETMVKRAMLRHNCPNSLSTGIHKKPRSNYQHR